MEQYILGIDLGTSSLKGIVVDSKGNVCASSHHGYDLSHPKQGYSEQNPEDWVQAFDSVMFQLLNEMPILKKALKGISISGQMHSLVLLDNEYEVLRPAILWNDVRTTKQCRKIEQILGESLIDITRNRALEGFTLPKILWVQEHEPEILDKTKIFVLPKDYLRYRLTDQVHMDYSDAAGTLLLDVSKKVWSTHILDAFNLEASICPPLVESTDYVGVLNAFLMEKFGFETMVKVFAGGADNACSAVGSGIYAAGTGMVSVGTSGVFLVYEPLGTKNYKGDLHFFNHADGAFYAMGVTLSAGKSLSWLKEVVSKDISYDSFVSSIDKIPSGSEGLLFTPYLTGERTPYADSKIRGSFIGLDLRHTKDHMVRAVIEGVTYSLRDSYEIVKAHSSTPLKQIVSVGGGAKNLQQLQIQANIFNVPVVSLKVEQGPALGAAMIAAVGLGWFKDFETCTESWVSYSNSVMPQEEEVEIYERYYHIYKKIYKATQPLCNELHDIIV